MKHRWSIKKVVRYSSAFCIHCGLIKEMSDKGEIFYYDTDHAYEKAPKCPRKQTYNQQKT